MDTLFEIFNDDLTLASGQTWTLPRSRYFRLSGFRGAYLLVELATAPGANPNGVAVVFQGSLTGEDAHFENLRTALTFTTQTFLTTTVTADNTPALGSLGRVQITNNNSASFTTRYRIVAGLTR